ncbi:MAG: carbon starvation protein A [Elusimicrobia bacterium]|nr:carbon starvation protein A [Elusimicrobiota bacterium]
MNSLILAVFCLAFFIFGYNFYRRKLTTLWEVSEQNPTPAHKNYDGVDYVPAKNWVILFGHHYASIAGAGPILGPVIACAIWGWFPAVIWIVFGSVFLGGVHDFSALMISLRNEGKSVADISEKVLGKNARIFFSIFVILALILVDAVFAIAAAKTLVKTAQIVIPTFSLIIIAVFTGFMIYKWKVPVPLATIIALVLVLFSLYLGYKNPVGLSVENPLKLWIVIFLVYGGIASLLPANLLLQPRDYLSFYFLFIGLAIGYVGLFFSRPPINAPAFISFSTARGMLWPTMCIIIACGAISGFHSLISSGTTAKQLASEKNAYKIGYGAMIFEGVLAILALISVVAGLKWSGINSYPAMVKTGDWIGTFATGYGNITKPILGTWGAFVAMIILNSFIVTTLDSATRITRYVFQELFGEKFKIGLFKKSLPTTIVIILIAYWFSTGPQKRIWPMFGASNQLLAGLVLLVVTVWLKIKKKKNLYTAIPAGFMLLTTAFALILEMKKNFASNNLLFGTALILFVASILMIWTAIEKIFKVKNG